MIGHSDHFAAQIPQPGCNRRTKGGNKERGLGLRCCKKLRAARREQRHNHGGIGLQYCAGGIGQGLRRLGVNDHLCGGQACGGQPCSNLSPAVAPAEVDQTASLTRRHNRPNQGIRIPGGGLRLKPKRLSSRGRAIPHTPCPARYPRQTRRRLRPGFRGQDDRAEITIRHRDRGKHRRYQRRQDHLNRIPKACAQIGGEAVALRGRTRQDHRDGAGLRGHVLGVTPAHVLWATWMATDLATLTFIGIESSCDDTAAAVVRHVEGALPQILSSVVEGQTALHAAFGGVVPEIAARAHAERLDGCVEQALAQAGLALSDIDGIAVTAGPGLIGGVLSGVMLAKGLSAGSGKPLIGVNHLAGHALTPRLTDGLAFPYLMLLVSGGHCQFLIADAPETFQRLGGTIDDAPGEAFDKVAKLLALPQPGGPRVEDQAKQGDPKRFAFPRPLLDRPGCDLSFSGLKSAVLRTRDALIAEKGGITVQDRRDICAGFQAAVAAVLAEKTRRAIAVYLERAPDSPALAVAGGVAANTAIRQALETVCAAQGVRFLAPPLRLCTDNAAMIAWAGIERFRIGARDGMDLSARPRWPLDQTAAPMIGSGKKGAKA